VTGPDGRVSETRHVSGTLRADGSAPVAFKVPVDHPVLWSSESPQLYDVTVRVKADGRVEQSQSLRTGLRSVQVRDGTLYLNGRRLWLHGAAIHEDMSGEGAALSDGDIDTIVSELRSAGVNVTRAHYLLSPRLLDALDAAGILVWEQAPVDHADAQLATASGRARALGLLRSTLLGDRSHPSVIINSVGNELSPNPSATPGTLSYLKQAVALTRRTDPAAAVALDTYCYPGYPRQPIYSSIDVLGISSYFGWYTGPPDHSVASFAALEPFLKLAHARYPRQALVVSEYGAEGLYDGPASVKGTFAFQTAYMQRTLSVLDGLPFMNGAIYWTLREFAVAPGWRGGAELPAGFDPDGIHHKGLIGYDGTPKPGFTVAEQLLAQTPAFAR
jgi:beta-glucuronidase